MVLSVDPVPDNIRGEAEAAGLRVMELPVAGPVEVTVLALPIGVGFEAGGCGLGLKRALFCGQS